MIVAPNPLNELARLAALKRYEILDTPPEESFEVFTQLVVQAIGVPAAVISFVDSARQWFKARINIVEQETSREVAFCAHTILGDGPMVITDATKDIRFCDNPLVTSDGGVRFYAGAPIRSADGYAIGVLCAIDSSPRDLGAAQSATLENLASLVASQLELRLANKRLAAELDERARIEQQLRDAGRELTLANLHLDAALNNISHGLCMFDANKKVVVSNQRFAEIYRIAPEQAEPGTTLDEIEAACKKQRTFGGSWSQERLGNTPIAHAEVKHLQDGRVISVRREVVANVGWMTSHEDITERHRGELKMAYMARHDLLTGLLNRAAFHEKAQEAAARLRGCDMTFSVILLDIDRFKQVNDSLGHPAGDALLREAALRLKASIGETDVLARLGGDEFAILQTTTSQQRDEAVAFARRIVKMFVRPFEIEGQTLVVSTSVGIALAAEHGVDPDELIKNADLALYRAKGEGRNRYTIFEPEMMQSANARHQLETDLRHAIENGELELYYQPQIEANTGKIAGAEALLRWHHPRKGFIPPDQFIPIAEETGLIVSIGEWALRTACAEARRWPSDRKVAVNLSPVQFRSGDLLATILVALAETGLPPERLEVEITENVLLESAVNNLTTIESLRRLGVSIALDDFGTGYSSLNYLTMFPFDRIKIDRVFAMNLMSRSECAAIISSIITLGRGLGIATLAEGVETRQQFELLRAAGVDHCQGFLFGRPVPASALYLTGSSQVTSEPEVA